MLAANHDPDETEPEGEERQGQRERPYRRPPDAQHRSIALYHSHAEQRHPRVLPVVAHDTKK